MLNCQISYFYTLSSKTGVVAGRSTLVKRERKGLENGRKRRRKRRGGSPGWESRKLVLLFNPQSCLPGFQEDDFVPPQKGVVVV